MSVLKRVFLWMAGVVAALVLAVCVVLVWFTVRGERHAETARYDELVARPGKSRFLIGL